MCQFCVLFANFIHRVDIACNINIYYLFMINFVVLMLKSVKFTCQFLCSKPVPFNRLLPIVYDQLTSDRNFLGAQHY